MEQRLRKAVGKRFEFKGWYVGVASDVIFNQRGWCVTISISRRNRILYLSCTRINTNHLQFRYTNTERRGETYTWTKAGWDIGTPVDLYLIRDRVCIWILGMDELAEDIDLNVYDVLEVEDL